MSVSASLTLIMPSRRMQRAISVMNKVNIVAKKVPTDICSKDGS